MFGELPELWLYLAVTTTACLIYRRMMTDPDAAQIPIRP